MRRLSCAITKKQYSKPKVSVGTVKKSIAAIASRWLLRKAARSGDWVQTEYSNQSSPSTFYSLYPENAEKVIPSTVSLIASQSQQFAVLGSTPGSCSSPAVVWSVPSGLPGTLTAGGLYTAPDSIASQQTVTITATSLGDSPTSISATATLIPAVTVNVTPGSVALSGSQTQQFTANVANTSNSAVTWTIDPAGAGSISAAGLYTAPATVATELTINITATSQADSSQSASATLTLSPTSPMPPSPGQCTSSGYNYQRTIIIDHTKVPNTDQTDFPFLFNTTDPSLATTANGGQVTNSNGYDIFFSTDPGGATKLDHELEEYNPITGQVIAWVRIPTLSHTTDTVLYMFYGNSNITAPQQNPTGVWNSNYLGVYYLANTGTGAAADSTAFGNNGTLTSVSPATGQIDGAGGFNGASSFVQIPEKDFPNFPTGVYDDDGLPNNQTTTLFSASFGAWFKTASAGGILEQLPNPDCTYLFTCIPNYNPQPGDNDPPGGANVYLYVDDNGSLRGGGITTTTAYNDNRWHFAVVTYATNGTDTLYVDGQNAGSTQLQFPVGYAPNYAYFFGTENTLLGSEGNWSWLYFNGSIDEVSISDIPRSSDWVQTEYNNQGSPSTFYTFNPASSAQVVPSAISLYASQSEQFAATDSCGSPVTWSMPAGAPGTLASSGFYTAPPSIAAQQAVTITATSQASGVTIDSSIVTLLPPPPPISLAAAAQPPYTTGSSQTFTATVLDQDGTPETGAVVTFTVTGANSNVGSATTNSSGLASYSYTGANSGNDTVRATAIANSQALTSGSVAVSWIAPAPPNPEGSVTLKVPPALGQAGLVGAFTNSSGTVIEPIAIGASAKSFIVPAGATQLQLGVDDDHYVDNGGAGFVVAVNGVSITVPAIAMPWNWVTGGLNNNYQYGMNDGTSPVVAATSLTQGGSVSIAYQSGTVSANYPLSPLVNANGDQATITGVTLYQGTYFPTLYTTAASYPVGQPAPLTALVVNGSGAPMPNVPVTLNVTGAKVQQLQATTDSTGTATYI